MSTQSDLTRALHDLAEVPGPANLADGALARAHRLGRRPRMVSAVAAVGVAGVLAVPFAIWHNGQTGGADLPVGVASATPPDPGTRPSGSPLSSMYPADPGPGDCVELENKDQQVAPADWPEFVRIAIAKLPPRTDYVMQSGYSVCTPADSPAPVAYAVINLGAGREHGHLTLNLDARADLRGGPTTCAGVRDLLASRVLPLNPMPIPQVLERELLFCTDGTASAPMVFGISYRLTVVVTARYADHRMVWMESIAAGDRGPQPEIGAEALRAVVTDPVLVALLPIG